MNREIRDLIYKGVRIKVRVIEGIACFDADSVAKQLGYTCAQGAMSAKDRLLGEIAHHADTVIQSQDALTRDTVPNGTVPIDTVPSDQVLEERVSRLEAALRSLNFN